MRRIKKRSLSMLALLLSCSLIVLPVVCSIVFFSTRTSALLENTAHETVSLYAAQFTETTSATLDTLRSGTYFLTSDSTTQAIMHAPDMPDQLALLALEQGLSRAMMMGSQNGITGIYLIKNPEQYLSILHNGIYSGTVRRVLAVYDNFSGANSARDLYIHPDYPGYCYYIVDYLDLATFKPFGKIIIELDTQSLIHTEYLSSIYGGSAVYLAGSDGYLIGSDGNETLENAALQLDTERSGYIRAGGQEYYHSSHLLRPYHIWLHVFIPKQQIFQAVYHTIVVYIVFSLIVLLITLLVGLIVYRILITPLRQMISKIHQLSSGDLTVRMDATPYRETETMAAAFNQMTDNLENLFDEVYTKGLLLRDAEFNLLESQIRPHFIFNVLEVINMRCLAAGQHDICRMVSNLAQLLRANITQRDKQTIPFREELRYVRYYLELQKERFGEGLHYQIDIEDEQLLSYYLPKLTIQPLVENSIVHGLENKRGGGTVRISIWEEEDFVCIRVTDDGIGFDSTRFDPDAEAPDTPAAGEKHNHVALVNIARRIRMLYGKPYSMSVNSTPGKGTDIFITLPIDIRELSKNAEEEPAS